MENIIKDIKLNCKDKTVEGIVRFLYKNGDIPFTAEYYREIWFFYEGALEMLKNKIEARKLTKEIMNIDESKFKRVKKKCENRPQ